MVLYPGAGNVGNSGLSRLGTVRREMGGCRGWGGKMLAESNGKPDRSDAYETALGREGQMWKLMEATHSEERRDRPVGQIPILIRREGGDTRLLVRDKPLPCILGRPPHLFPAPPQVFLSPHHPCSTF